MVASVDSSANDAQSTSGSRARETHAEAEAAEPSARRVFSALPYCLPSGWPLTLVSIPLRKRKARAVNSAEEPRVRYIPILKEQCRRQNHRRQGEQRASFVASRSQPAQEDGSSQPVPVVEACGI